LISARYAARGLDDGAVEGCMTEQHDHHLAEARENLRLARSVRDAASQRGDTAIVAREDELILRMEERLRELEAALDDHGGEPGGAS
jgi:hypothetical protein